MINITRVDIGQREKDLVNQVLESGQLAQGKMVSEFESQFAKVSGAPYNSALSSGTTALVLALRALGIGPGDEVITSPFTFIATINAILETGATARLVDIEPDTFLMDATLLENAVNHRTKVIIPVHLFGQPCDMATTTAVAQAHGLRIVEDAAQAHGATFADQKVGSFDIAAFSFYATKNMTTGEGGAVTTTDVNVDETVRVLRNQGMKGRYEYVAQGFNYRMTDLQAAIGIGQLERLEATTANRATNANYLTSLLKNFPELITPVVREDRTHVWHQYTVRLSSDTGVTRDELIEKLRRRGVGSMAYYPYSVTEYPYYAARDDVVCDDDSVSRSCAASVLSLPIHAGLTKDDLDHIASACGSALAEKTE